MTDELMTGKQDRGFTLSELLVAMATGLTVLAGVYTFYVTNQQTYSIQDQLLGTQQNLRIALELLVEDVQAAGGAGVPVQVAVAVTNSSTGADSLSLLIPESAICPSPAPRDIPIVNYNAAATNMDVTEDSTCAAMVDKVGIVVTADGLNYRTIQITRVQDVGPSNDNVNFSPGLSPLSSPGGLGADYTGGTLLLVRQVTYTIDLSDPTKPVLRRNFNDGAGAQPLANFIEDMQIALGYDRDSDGILAEIGSAANDDEWVFNVAGESNATEAPTNLRAVRIVLAGRTKFSDPRFQGLLPTILDRGEGGVDGYRRKIRATRVQIRNLGV